MDSGGKRVKQAGAAEPVRIVGMKGEIKDFMCLCIPTFFWLLPVPGPSDMRNIMFFLSATATKLLFSVIVLL